MTARRRFSSERGSVTIPNNETPADMNTGRSVIGACGNSGSSRSDSVAAVEDSWSGIPRSAGRRSTVGSALVDETTVANHCRVASIIARGTVAYCGAVIAISMRPGRVLYSSAIPDWESDSAQRLADGSLSLSQIRIERTGGAAAVCRSTSVSDCSVAADKEKPPASSVLGFVRFASGSPSEPGDPLMAMPASCVTRSSRTYRRPLTTGPIKINDSTIRHSAAASAASNAPSRIPSKHIRSTPVLCRSS